MLAQERIPMIAYHFLWPGNGHIAKAGEGFHFYSARMIMQTLPG